MPIPTDLPPSIMSHVSIGTNAFVRDLDDHKIEAMFWDESAG